MEKEVAAADANRRFSEILRSVKAGESVVVTSHGSPVARMSPVVEDGGEGARAALFERLRREPAMKVGRRRRDESYEGGL